MGWVTYGSSRLTLIVKLSHACVLCAKHWRPSTDYHMVQLKFETFEACEGFLFSLSGKNTLHLKFLAHSRVVTRETKRKTTTKTKYSINTQRVVRSLHSKWAFTLVRLCYGESKNYKFHGSKSFSVDLNLREWRVGEKNCRSVMALLLLSICCCKQGQPQKNGSMFPHCCRSFKFELPIRTDLPSSYVGQIFLLSCSSQFLQFVATVFSTSQGFYLTTV